MVAEEYLKDRDMDRIWKKYADLPAIEEIVGYLGGTDGDDPPNSIPDQVGGWYSPKKDHEYWPAYLSLMRDPDRRGLPDKAVKSIDTSSTKIINYIFDPSEEGERKSYGLVVGYVQSGKTANFTGLMAKAADSGFDLFVVLSGMYNDLRQQTQMRLEKELTGQLTFTPGEGEWHLDEKIYRQTWKQVTESNIEEGDIHQDRANRNIELLKTPGPSLVVTKKQKDSLEKLIEWALGLTKEERGRVNLMLIDDEADLASINTEANSKAGRDANTINRLLREFLHLFDRRAYVGYTATPFANVFINPNGDGVQTEDPRIVGQGAPQDLDTLFPKDFLVALNKPDGYMGFMEMFPENDEGAPFDPKRNVPEKEAKRIRGFLHDDYAPNAKELGDEFLNALREHFITQVLRSKRSGNRNFHHTMLVHSSITIKNHKPLVSRIEQNLRLWKGAFRSPKGRPTRKKIVSAFEGYYRKYYLEEGTRKWFDTDENGILLEPPSWEDVLEELKWISKNKWPVVLNVSSDEDVGADLDYHMYPKGRSIIAVGGLRLSRGLTLEGLTVSYFLRKAQEMKYDTVMQQGRWFGFRIGYEDLVRVYTTPELLGKLTKIGRVERILRDSIGRYEDTGKTPMDFGVQVLKMSDMIPTEQKKMPNVSTTKVNLYEKIVPSWGEFSFDRPDLLKGNLEKVAKFLNSLGDPRRPDYSKSKSHLWTCRDLGVVTDFLSSLTPHAKKDLSHFGNDFFEYVQRRSSSGRGELTEWSIGLISLQKGDTTRPLSEFGCDLEIIKPRRGRLVDKDTLGYFAQSDNFVLDLPGTPEDYINKEGSFSLSKMWGARDPSNPFIAIYVFDKDFEPTTDSKTKMFRTDGEKKGATDVVAVSVALPSASMTDKELRDEREFWYNAFLPKGPEEE